MGRTIKYHRAQIREFLGFREATVEDGEALVAWLDEHVLPEDQHLDHLHGKVLDRCRALHLEPPTPERIDRLVRSALHAFEKRFCAATLKRLSPQTRERLEALLIPDPSSTSGTHPDPEPGRAAIIELLADSGPPGLKSLLEEIAKLDRIRALGLPPKLFEGISPQVLQSYRQRLAVEAPYELRRHATPLRLTLLAVFGHLRERELTDTLVDLLLNTVHRIGARAERRVERELLEDLKRVAGKNGLLFQLAEASLAQPDGIVKDVVYPVVNEQTLRDLVKEWQATGPAYRKQVQMVVRNSYRSHYRRMVPRLLDALEFRSNNTRHQPVLRALALVKKYADSKVLCYPADEEVPLEGVVRDSWQEAVLERDKDGNTRVNRISYEICVLQALRERLRCKEVWVRGANRYRNPDEDLPADFDEKRDAYYAALQLSKRRRRVRRPGAAGDGRGPGRLQPHRTAEPPRADPVQSGWPDRAVAPGSPARAGKSPRPQGGPGGSVAHDQPAGHAQGNRPARPLQRRLPQCDRLRKHGSGHPAAAAVALPVRPGDEHGPQADGRRRARRHLQGPPLRPAAVHHQGPVAARHHSGRQRDLPRASAPDLGRGHDGLRLRLQEVRRLGPEPLDRVARPLRRPGRDDLLARRAEGGCIYSQLKTCSSSEVAAMIEGVLRHCTEMAVDRQYVDSHGQSEVAFAFCRLLGFQLLPRLKAIHKQKLYRPEAGKPDAFPRLQPVLSRPINWDLIRQQYDAMVKYATALRLGTAETEAILRRFTRNNVQHPTYKALAELGKALKTTFLCRYLQSEALRREIQEGLNVVENWNSANAFILFGKGGELASNRQEDQEVSMLALHLLQISMVYINTLMIQRVLSEPSWSGRLTTEDLRGLTPLIYGHVNPYGIFRLDMNARLPIDPTEALAA